MSNLMQCPPALLRAGAEFLLDIGNQIGHNGRHGRAELHGHWARHYIGDTRHYYRRLNIANLSLMQLLAAARRRPFFDEADPQDGLLVFRHPDGTCLHLWYTLSDDLQEIAA